MSILAKDNDVIISVRDLKTFFYSGNRCNPVINGVSLEVKRGKTLCIVGESGCGKSVTASCIMQLLPDLARIEEGSILYKYEDGSEIDIAKLKKRGKEMRSLRGKDMAMVFQDPMTALNPVYTIGWQLCEMIRAHENISKEQAWARGIEMLKQMGIPQPEKRIKQYPHEFSGGMRQRAMIAMAMLCNPRVLIADEPTTALDVTCQAQIFELIENLKEQYGTGILLITHDMGVVCEIADEVAVMYMGYIVESGPVQKVMKMPAHPYTRALIRSIPILGMGSQQELLPVRGSTPDPYHRPMGCQFSPRCDHACERCNNIPPETELGGGHIVRCWKAEEVCTIG